MDSGSVISVTAASKAAKLVVGDVVEIQERDSGDLVITSIATAERTLVRSYRGASRRMASHLDELWIVTAPPPLLNLDSIDRIATAAAIAGIGVTLLFNKVDHPGEPDWAGVIRAYAALGFDTYSCSAKFERGLEPLRERLESPQLRTIGLCGLSGVGKSTLLKRLLPDVNRTVGEVSRTGQGKQTTTQAQAFLYPRRDGSICLLVDFPGVQWFGIEHVEPRELSLGFPEIRHYAAGCEFLDCSHVVEVNCEVKRAVASGSIEPWRYEHFCILAREIRDHRKY